MLDRVSNVIGLLNHYAFMLHLIMDYRYFLVSVVARKYAITMPDQGMIVKLTVISVYCKL